jgi:hypothetical protein
LALPKYDFETQLPFHPFPSIFAENTHHFAPYKNSLPYSPKKTPPLCSVQKLQHFSPYSSDIQSIQVSPNTTTSTNTQFHKLAATVHHSTLCSIRQRPTKHTSFAKYHDLDQYTVSQARCYDSPQVHPTPFPSFLLLSTRRLHWLFTYLDKTDMLYCKEHAHWRRTFLTI